MSEVFNEMPLQQAFDALQDIVEKLEDPKITIDESLELYEHACKLVVYCQRRLNETQNRITDINERVAELRQNGEPLFEEQENEE